MAKGVLGNDPFQRGAADRSETAAADARTPAKPRVKASAKPAKKAARKAAQGTAPKPAASGKSAAASAGQAAKPARAAARKAAAKRPAPGAGRASAPGPAVGPIHAHGETPAVPELVPVPPTTEIADAEPPAPAHLPREESARQAPTSALTRAELPFDAGSGARRVGQAGDLSQRASDMLRLARNMAAQALASEGMGRAVGVAQGLLGALRAGLGTGGSSALDVYGKDAALVGDLRPVLDFLYERYWRVSVQGAELIPAGPVVLVANHSGALPFDGPVMQLALARERPDLAEARWLVEDQVFHAPVLGTLFNRLGAVRACQDNAERLLEEGRPLVVFPEGIQGLSKPFAQRYQLKRFGRGGFVKLALRTGAPIVPVAIVGAEETSPLLARLPGEFLGLPYLPLTPLGPLPLPAKWSIRFGAPLALGEQGPAAAGDLSEVQRLTERTRESIQGMLQAQLQERRSVFAG